MSYKDLPPGRQPPSEIYAFIEIPRGEGSIKYEFDKNAGVLMVDRMTSTAMHYPGNYGFVPATLGQDGDPLDVLVIGAEKIYPGAVVPVRPIGVLIMQDEKGFDEKIIAVPADSLTDACRHIKDIWDVPQAQRDAIEHFFTHYKDLDGGRWTKTGGWGDTKRAQDIISAAIVRAKPGATPANPAP